ncbi:MAG TPA: energy-coupling factor transporter transmembrane component T [Solirubrobacterales bacterium]|nr:energy-coupling factor transporter transmembrane component T [Solirubrobacterales bacterium]
MRSPFAYRPRPGPLQAASPGAAVAYLGAPVAISVRYSSPLVLLAVGAGVYLGGSLAGAGGALRVALRMGLTLGLLIVAVNALVVDRGETVLARLGEWPLLGRVDVTAEAIAAGAVIGLRAAVAMLAFAVYSACVDPDRVLRALRPYAGRSALTATLASRLVPVATADAGRLRDATRLRGPAAAPLGRAAMARRLLAGSLDRAVDVAATLELRGYGLAPPPRQTVGRSTPPECGRCAQRSRFDRRFYTAGMLLLFVGVTGKLLGADEFSAYPTVEVGVGAATLAVSAAAVLAGLVPWRRRG